MQKEIGISYHRHLDFKAQLQVARWQLGTSSWEQVKAKAPPSQERQGRAHRSSPRGHTGDESTLFMYNVRNCMFHHKHWKLTLRQAECYFFHQPHPKGVLKGNAWEMARICEQVNWWSLARSGSVPAHWPILMSEKDFPQPIPVLGADSNEAFRT